MNLHRSCRLRSATSCSDSEVIKSPQTLAGGQALWHLLQTSDQFFPTGSFAFSHALEMYVAAGLVRDRVTCQQLFVHLFNHSIGPTDLVFCARAHRLAAGPGAVDAKVSALAELDLVLAAMKVPRELRLESRHLGRSFLRAVMALSPQLLVHEFRNRVQQGTIPGHHAVVFGMAAHELGLPESSALPAFLYAIAAGLAAAAVRLVPLGQSDGQRLLHDLQPYCARLVQRYAHMDPEDAWSSTPGLDIRSMQHERLYSRLCRS